MFIGVSKRLIKGYADGMKHIFSVITFLLCLCLIFTGCEGKNSGGSSINPEEVLSKDASYALGMNIGSSFKADGFYPDIEEFKKGLQDVLYDSNTRFSMDEIFDIFFQSYNEIQERKNMSVMQGETDFLTENSRKPGISITSSGLQYEVIVEGYGEKPGAFDMVKVHYEGALTDGTVFDSSYSRGEPIDFFLTDVIPGWTEGLQLMSVGSKYRLFIPSELGYGASGAGGLIPPYSTLVFEVELLEITAGNHDHDHDDADFDFFF